ncbi:MAG TPA: response regulator [Desulfuromonadales bacterium]|nr:response regulator [Desulfuromonadales bacterium]
MNNLLIIDDDKELCELLGDYLGCEGFTVEAVNEPAAGIKRALSGEHDLVVLDVMMPNMNGFDALRLIRAASQIPVLMLTARGSDIDPVTVTGHRELLRQAFENVVRNAVRYTLENTCVELSLCVQELPDGACVVAEVRDHGNGVPDGELAKIFRPFYRISDGRERESGGVGIGLAITDRAVRLHGGNVQAFNAADGGLIVRIELPIA